MTEMPLIMGDLYIALRKAGADEKSAMAAAEEAYGAFAGRPIAGSSTKGSLPRSARQLTWMMAANLALMSIVFVLLVVIDR
jgi:hypothetical protein